MVKRDDIRRAFVLEKSFVQQSHFARADEIDAEFRRFDFQFREQFIHDLLEQTRVDLFRPLAIGNDDR